MNWSAALSTFGLIFLAEIGDKTQLATISMVARSGAPASVFVGASAALVSVTLIGVLLGGAVTRVVSPATLSRIAGAAFIAMGVWMLFSGDDAG